jgi:cystathionine beta-lyase/cystathionine gamma-synthase
MKDNNLLLYIENIIKNAPENWVNLTTHRLDIYNEELAKVEFLKEFEKLYNINTFSKSALKKLPTAYDYIRLGHPLSSVLEWFLAQKNNLNSENVISFSSRSMPILAILRKNLFDNINTQIVFKNELPPFFNTEKLKEVYGYQFELNQIKSTSEIKKFDGSIIYISDDHNIDELDENSNIDFQVNIHNQLGCVIYIKNDASFISEIQHVRRRESIAMTPADSYTALKLLTKKIDTVPIKTDIEFKKAKVLDTINNITKASSKALLGSSGLSVQYAIMMGLIDYANENYKGKDIKIIVPPNCYGGTNDQARRVAACLSNVEVLDLPVDGENDMVKSTNKVLDEVAKIDAVPLIIAEIPTNPRVEVPELITLEKALSKERKTVNGNLAIAPVFILDQTFCPNVNFLGDDEILSSVKTISYVSGSKFPSGGKCTAGYCVANKKAVCLMDKIENHFKICDNEATHLQIEILAEQMPSMIQRIKDAYINTRDFVSFIKKTLPSSKINFVSEELAKQDFTPSVFSLDLPTKGNSSEEKENYKRALNLKLINLMISKIPNESKYCVSYGQLKGCYWTIPATSTQGTTKEDDKDYIARVSVSPDLDLDLHKEVFLEFVKLI